MSIGSFPPVFTSMGGAVQRVVGELAAEQARQGHEVMVLSPGRQTVTAEIAGVEVRYLRCTVRSPWMHLEFQARAFVIAARWRPDILHVHDEPESGLATRPLAFPTVLGYDNFYFRGGRRSTLFPLYRRSLRAFDLLLPCSSYCGEASMRYWNLPRERVHVVPNGVNTAVFAPDPESAGRERDGLRGPVAFYLGRICSQKGIDTLLEAKRQLNAAGFDFELALAGPIGEFDGSGASDIDAWKRAIDRAGARYLGRVEDDRLPGLLSMADVFVMPTAELEMQGMAGLEAQACGTPVIASDHGGLRETVPESCGIRFPPGNAEKLAEAIVEMLTDKSRRDRCAAAALEHANSLAWPRIVERLVPLYEAAVERRR
jgi:glycosyltransferase involved in cell wall biosynthesis